MWKSSVSVRIFYVVLIENRFKRVKVELFRGLESEPNDGRVEKTSKLESDVFESSAGWGSISLLTMTDQPG